MKRKYCILNFFGAGLLSLFCVSSVAQSFREGSNVVSAGIGLGSSIASSTSYTKQSPAISVSFEHGQWEVAGPGAISLGAYIGFKSYENYFITQQNYTINESWDYTLIGIRGAYHYNGFRDEKFDPYGGLMISYNIVNYSYSDDNPFKDEYTTPDSKFGGTLFFGGRYYFSDHFAGYAELGWGVAFLSLGVSYNIE